MVGPLFQSHRRFSALLMFDGQIQAQSYEASFAEDITADQLRAPSQRFKMDDLFGDLPPPCNATKSLDPLLFFC